MLETALGNLVGDCLLAAAFLSYCGPFDSEYRYKLLQEYWLKSVTTLHIPGSADFDFCLFLAKPEDVRDWNIQGLPADAFSTENGVMVTRGTRWPLMVDPQAQHRFYTLYHGLTLRPSVLLHVDRQYLARMDLTARGTR